MNAGNVCCCRCACVRRMKRCPTQIAGHTIHLKLLLISINRDRLNTISHSVRMFTCNCFSREDGSNFLLSVGIMCILRTSATFPALRQVRTRLSIASHSNRQVFSIFSRITSGAKVIVMRHSRPMTRGAALAGSPVGSTTIVGGTTPGRETEEALSGVNATGENDNAEYTMLVPSPVAASLWSALSTQPSVVVAGEEEWHVLRIKQGG